VSLIVQNRRACTPPAAGGALLLVGQSSAGARSLSKWEGQRELCTIDIAAIGDCRLQMF